MTLVDFIEALDAMRRDPRELNYDPELVRQVAPHLRGEAEAEILRRVEQGDMLAFETAAALKLTAAVAALQEQRHRGTLFSRAAAERALFSLHGDPLPVDERADPILRGLDAFALARSDSPDAIPALLALLSDPGVHARVHASEGLVEKLGLKPLARPQGSPLHTLLLGVSSQIPSVWPQAASALRPILAAVRAGHSPESLDLVHRPSADPEALNRFWSQATKWHPFDVANIESMSEHDRAFAEMVLVTRLRFGDVNALQALRALRVPGWASHVRAALPWVEKRTDVVTAYQAALAGD